MTNIEFPKIKLLLWDWSGTVSDDRKPVYEANQRLLEKYDYPRLTLDEWRDGRAGWNAGNFLAEELKLPIERLYKEFGEIFATTKIELNEPQPYAGAVDALIALTDGRASEIISSHTQDHLENEVRAYGIGDYISHVRGSVSDKVPVIVRSVTEAGLSPAQVLYIGDTVQDVRAARQAGVNMAAVTYGYHSVELLRAEQPDILVGSLSELA